ncbi:MAG: hypothetical protein JNM17_13800 [Archangium sp.]|nr:hypothetical protein [Archangium sp.]
MSEPDDLEAKVKSLEAELDVVRGKLNARDAAQARELEKLTNEAASLDVTVQKLEKELESLSAAHATETERAKELADESRRAQAHVKDLRDKLNVSKKR